MRYLVLCEDKSYCVVLEEELNFEDQNPGAHREIKAGDKISFFFEGFGDILFKGTVIKKSSKLFLKY